MERGESRRQVGDAAAHHLEQALGQLVGGGRVVQIDGDAQLALRAEQRRDERGEDLRRVVPAGDAVLVVADPHQARILERLDGAERHVGVGAGARRIVDQIVGDEARRRRGQPALVAQVEQRAVDEIDGADVDDLRVRLDVGDQQLDGVQVAGDGLADARREVGREQARVLGAGRVDDQVGGPDALDHPRVDRRARRVAGEQGPQPVGVEAGDRRIAGVERADRRGRSRGSGHPGGC